MRKPMSRRGVTVFDVIVAVALLTAVGLTLVPAVAARTREEENRIKCASNLRMLGLAMKMYANGETRTVAFPRTRYDIRTADKPAFYTRPDAADPFKADGPDVNDNTAPVWLLLRTQEITPEAFVCPSAGTKAFAFAYGKTPTDFANFASAKTLSYSTQLQYGTKRAIENGFTFSDAMSADAPLMADMNPGSPEVLTVTPDDAPARQQKANSPNHGGRGQNVLYADGHAEFAATVWAGTRRPGADVGGDNIYAHRPATPDPSDTAKSAGIVGPMTGPDDAVLLPTWDAAIPLPKIDFTAPGVEPERPATPRRRRS